MPILNGNAIRFQRCDLLAKVEAFASETLADLIRRKVNQGEFYYYADFLSPAVFGLVNWEQIHLADLEQMPSTKRLFVDATLAARIALSANSYRHKEIQEGRRSFHDISEVELAGYILPRLEVILCCWGLAANTYGEPFAERQLTEEERDRLTRYHWTG